MKKILICLTAAMLAACGSAAPVYAAGPAGVVEKLYVQTGAGAKARTVASKLNESVSITDFGAVPDDGKDDTVAIQKAINAHPRVYMPAGTFNVNAVPGIIVRTGLHLTGAGKNKTILIAAPGGGTTDQIKAYERGSVIRRNFSPSPATNPYVNDVYLADFAVVLNHPVASVTTTEIQVGIDLRNITRSTVERVHVGNIAPIGGAYVKADPGAYGSQGYGIVVGNVSSGESSYAGGEVNTIRNCAVWGAFKLITIDDGTLTPLSSAHATAVLNTDLQAGHHLLVQESAYTAGMSWRDNTLQDVKKQPGDVSNSFVMRIEGYNNEVGGGYIEAGSGANYLMYLGGGSKNNHVRMSYYSATNSGLITDVGGKNEVEYFENTGSLVGGVDPFGKPVKLYDRALNSAWVKFHWSGSEIVIEGGQGATVVRNGAGDYSVTWTYAFPNTNYSISTGIDTNASGHAGAVTVASHSSSNARIYTYAINGGATTLIDPRYVWVRAGQ